MLFWLLSLLLLIPALLIFLLPVLRVRKHQSEEDRTALNVATYQERIAELEIQHADGILDAAQLEQGKAEAGRDLLDDTSGQTAVSTGKLGITPPLLAALLIPLAGAVLYQVFGELDKVRFTYDNVEAPKTEEEAIERLQQLVRFQPDSAGDWFALGRMYFNRGEFKEALAAFDKTILLVGKHPDVLSPWVQSLYFVNDNQWTAQMQDAIERVLKNNPFDAAILGFVGIASFESGNFDVALQAWNRLLDQMDPRDPSAQAVLTGIERAEQAVAEYGAPNPQASKGPVLPAAPEQLPASQSGLIHLQVSLAQQLEGQVDAEATVFVFARAAGEQQIPLAAQRLSVAQLPAQIRLSDADILMPQSLLSQASEVVVQASISLDGNASTPQWISQPQTATVDSQEQLELHIDTAVE